jgi:hypothetical protein
MLNKKQILRSLEYFYEKTQVQPENIIVFGGASLVLQDCLDATRDIDLLASDKNNELCSKLENEGISVITWEDKAYLSFRLNKIHYEIIYPDLLQFYQNYEEKYFIRHKSNLIYVRPAERVLIDYEKLLKRKDNIAHPNKLNTYKQRVRNLRRQL